jgi:hypothetical protein
VIDPRAHWITAHQTSIVRLQQFGDDLHVGHARIEPNEGQNCELEAELPEAFRSSDWFD